MSKHNIKRTESSVKKNTLTVEESSQLNIEPDERMEYVYTGPLSREDKVERFQQMPRLNITDDLLRSDTLQEDSWLHHNKGYEQTGFSPASRLTPQTVNNLELVYSKELAVPASGSCGGGGLESTPLIVPTNPPIMYLTQSNAVVRAWNARTGEEFWRFQYGLPEGTIPNGNRGVAVWQDKVYFGTPLLDIVTLNRYTGEKLNETQLLLDEQDQERIHFSAAPMIFDSKLFIGQAGDANEWTRVFAIDAENGNVVWRSETAPTDQWVGDTYKFSSCNGWMSPAIDPESNTVFWSVANPCPWFNGTVRPGPNKHADSIIAFDANTGEIKWANQLLAHNLWDYDVDETPTVFNMEVDGEPRRVLSVETKAAWTYVIDVETGNILERSQPFAKQAGNFLGLPPLGKENAAPIYPSISGGTEWPTDSFSPQTGLRYVGAMNAGMKIYHDTDYNPEAVGEYVGGGFIPLENPNNSAEVVAIDLADGEITWKYRFEDVDPTMSSPWPGGTTATACNLVFAGSPGGNFVALHAETGKLLWKHNTGNRITASPVVWDDPGAGKQFVAIAANDQIVVYAGG